MSELSAETFGTNQQETVSYRRLYFDHTDPYDPTPIEELEGQLMLSVHERCSDGPGPQYYVECDSGSIEDIKLTLDFYGFWTSIESRGQIEIQELQ